MPVVNENRFALRMMMVRPIYDSLVEALLKVTTLKQPQVDALVRVRAKVAVAMNRTESGRRATWVSLTREERETLWRLSHAMRSQLGERAQPWLYLDSILWAGEPAPLAPVGARR